MAQCPDLFAWSLDAVADAREKDERAGLPPFASITDLFEWDEQYSAWQAEFSRWNANGQPALVWGGKDDPTSTRLRQ